MSGDLMEHVRTFFNICLFETILIYFLHTIYIRVSPTITSELFTGWFILLLHDRALLPKTERNLTTELSIYAIMGKTATDPKPEQFIGLNPTRKPIPPPPFVYWLVLPVLKASHCNNNTKFTVVYFFNEQLSYRCE